MLRPNSCPTCGARMELVSVNGQPPQSAAAGWRPLETSGPVNESFCPTANLGCSHEAPRSRAGSLTGTAGAGEAMHLPELTAARGRATRALLTGAGAAVDRGAAPGGKQTPAQLSGSPT